MKFSVEKPPLAAFIKLRDLAFGWVLFGTFSMNLLTGCTVASPEVSLLQDLSPFSSKSTSPFLQNQSGSYFVVSGFCLPQVTGFELRLDDLPLWTPLPSTPPSPASQEYLVDNPEYDMDCSDGRFSFYIFHSQALSNFTLNSITREDPYKIEIRALAAIELPSLIFERPRPASLRLETYSYSTVSGALEIMESQILKLTLRDSTGEETRAFDTDINITLEIDNVTNPGNAAGNLYKEDCISTLGASDLTFSINDTEREKEYCYVANPASAGDTVRIQANASDLTSSAQDLYIAPAYSAGLRLTPVTTDSNMPPYFIKGAEYKLNLNFIPLFGTDNRSVTSFSGSLTMFSSSSLVKMKADAGDTQCPTAYTQNFSCPSFTGTQQEVTMYVDPSYGSSSFSLTATAAAMTSCNAGCSISDPDNAPYSFNIGSYWPLQLYVPVVSGPLTYSSPYFSPHSYDSNHQQISIGECQTATVGAGNSKNQLIPSPSAITFTMGSSDGSVSYFGTYSDCVDNINSVTSKNFPVAVSEAGKTVYYRVNSFPGSGAIHFTIEDGSGSWTKTYYADSND